jgi:hypothetical protein
MVKLTITMESQSLSFKIKHKEISYLDLDPEEPWISGQTSRSQYDMEEVHFTDCIVCSDDLTLEEIDLLDLLENKKGACLTIEESCLIRKYVKCGKLPTSKLLRVITLQKHLLKRGYLSSIAKDSEKDSATLKQLLSPLCDEEDNIEIEGLISKQF